jgi:hypothetical protein
MADAPDKGLELFKYDFDICQVLLVSLEPVDRIFGRHSDRKNAILAS